MGKVSAKMSKTEGSEGFYSLSMAPVKISF